MSHPLLDITSITQTPESYLNTIGTIFTIFGEHSQDSGNISYGVSLGSEKYFIKTAGYPDDPKPYLSHPQRVALLHNAVRLRRSCAHALLPQLHQVIESPHGPLLIYDWVAGELIGADRITCKDPESAFQRFRRLPVAEILRVLDLIFDLHHALARSGWIAVDFYDGCMIYDFERQILHLVDLDMYRPAPFTNHMGRMFGSSRFMAPEEFELHAPIDQRTNVFTMGRTAAIFLSESSDGTLEQSAFRGSNALYDVIRRACHADRHKRFESLATFYAAWKQARLEE